jgi:micrococcal nuclease
MEYGNLYTYNVRSLDRIVDGDTVDVTIDLGFDVMIKQRVRLFGIDTPEKRTSDPIEKVFGLAATQFLTDMLTDPNLESMIIKTSLDDKGKFGRVLGTIWTSVLDVQTNVNEAMISNHHAARYLGQNREAIEDIHLANRTILLNEGKVTLPPA